MGEYGYLKTEKNIYAAMHLAQNPFDIFPLFKDFRNKEACIKEEAVFLLPESLENKLEILTSIKDKRTLVYGLFGVGKTSFVDFILYITYHYRRRFCSRVIITEANVEKAINEFLLTICFDIVQEIEQRKLTKPLALIRKWVAEKRYGDALFDNMIRLAGNYTEKVEDNTIKVSQKGANVSLALTGGHLQYEEQIERRRCIQNYVQILPMKNIAQYLADFLEIVTQIGYESITIFMDEADHLGKLDEFLRMLTRSREILFTKGYTFFVAGSAEIAKYTEAVGAIFDKIVFVPPLTKDNFKRFLQNRVHNVAPKIGIEDLFEEESLDFIFEQSKGISKTLLRLTENALDFAASKNDEKVSIAHCLESQDTDYNKIEQVLKKSHLALLKYLAGISYTSASDEKLQQLVGVKRIQLRNLLEELLQLGYVRKESRGKTKYYSISSQYKNYFLNS